MSVKITICTPTYNRSHLLSNLYNSLKNQKFEEFEWLVIDDGSTDDTENTINKFIKENKINIRYIRKCNGGKHTALNIGIENAYGKLFWIVDSDDYITEEALNIIWDKWSGIEDKSKFAGIGFLKGYDEKSIIGTSFKGNYLDADSIEYRYKYKIKGDKAEVFCTDVLKKNKFPEFDDEKYVTESVVWNRIANQGLKIRWFNEIIYICEYLEGGLTNTSDKNIMDSWKGTTLYYKELLSYNEVPLKEKILNGARAYLHYCYIKGIGFRGIYNITKNPIYIFLSYMIYISKFIKRSFKL